MIGIVNVELFDSIVVVKFDEVVAVVELFDSVVVADVEAVAAISCLKLRTTLERSQLPVTDGSSQLPLPVVDLELQGLIVRSGHSQLPEVESSQLPLLVVDLAIRVLQGLVVLPD